MIAKFQWRRRGVVDVPDPDLTGNTLIVSPKQSVYPYDERARWDGCAAVSRGTDAPEVGVPKQDVADAVRRATFS